MADDLPEGFTIDQPTQSGGLPEGFTVDQPKTFGQKAAEVWEYPTPGSVVSVAKGVYDWGKSALGAYPAEVQKLSTPEPTREEDYPAYRQQQEELQKKEFLGSAAGAALFSPLSAGAIGSRVVGQATVPKTPFGVTLSKGQETGELPLIRKEQAAIRGQLGPQAEAKASEFMQQQKEQMQQARSDIAAGFGPRPIEGPQEAGEITQQAIQREAAKAKANVGNLYEEAKALPGDIHVGAFEGIGQKIRGDLTLRDNPVIVDDKLTPYASKSLQFIDDAVSKLKIQNVADPFAIPSGYRNIPDAVNLKGIDQWRKTLSSMRNQAFTSGNASDGRATQAVIDSFDNYINGLVNSRAFSGDQKVVQAWNDARAAYSDYRSTFTSRKGDPVGRVVEKITGNKEYTETPNAVADYLYGASGVNPSSLNVGVANRVKSIVGGPNTQEWGAIKQGLFSRLTSPAEGMTGWGPGRVSQKLNQFLNGDGKEMSNVIFSQQERKMLQNFADLNRHLEVPPTGANRSETSTFMSSMLNRLGGWLGIVTGAMLAHEILPAMPYGISEALGASMAMGVKQASQRLAARKIADQMPMMTDLVKKYNKANETYSRNNSIKNRATLEFATTNLGRAIKSLGIDTSRIPVPQMPATSAADQYQQ